MAQAAVGTGAAPTAIIAIGRFDPALQGESRCRADAGPTCPGLAGQSYRKDIFWTLMTCHKRYIDEKLIDALSEMEAIVNLGAGCVS
jgi:O-methyltransferase involved in polyketide biosynthesis